MTTTQMVDVFGYRRQIKEAKRLISEGRAQIKSAKRLEAHAELLFEEVQMLHGMPYPVFEDKQETAFEKRNTGIENITQGLEAYRCLLSYENLEHFTRIKNGITGTINEFKSVLDADIVKQYTNSLYVGPE